MDDNLPGKKDEEKLLFGDNYTPPSKEELDAVRQAFEEKLIHHRFSYLVNENPQKEGE